MRILLAHNNYTVQGGAEVFYHEVARVLRAQGHVVAMFSAAEPGLDVPGVEHFPEAVDYRAGGLLTRVRHLPGLVYNRKAKAAMARLIAEFRPDVIHAFAIYVRLTPAILEAAKEAGVPVVLSCNDYKHLCPNYKLFHNGRNCEECKGGRFHRALVNRCCHGSTAFSAASMIEAYAHDRRDIWCKNVSCFLFASKFMARKTEEFWGKDRVQIDFLRNPFDAKKYHVAPNVGRYMLYFGRLIDEKGVQVLLKAAAMTPEVPVVIVGDGPDMDQTIARAATLDNVRVVGPAWGDDLADWLRGARAVVVPSLWHENFPYVILQAFAAATPVVGARRGGIPELVDAGPHGWTYEASDASALAALLRDVAAAPDDQIAAMGAAAQAYVAAEFTDDAIYTRLMAIYERVTQ
ncbi:glycosyltransferase [Phaeovulum sp.]|uniref:glycosyltransferase n=1 Tax=Phaeovulum sp. TaxID=2934796 RepID=UPI0039E37AEA